MTERLHGTMPEDSNGTIAAAERIDLEQLPPAPELPRRPFERHLAAIMTTRRRLLVGAAACLIWAALVGTVVPAWGLTSTVLCFVLGLAGGLCIGTRLGLGETERALRYVLRHDRRVTPEGERS